MLIVFAFAGPEGLLQLQDKSRLTRSVSISNTGTDYTVWKEEYETDTMRRLQNLADGIAAGKQYYISEQDYEAATDGEIYSLIDEYILNTEWNYTFQDMGVIPEDYFFKNMDTDNISIKRYILYDEKLSDGVAIMAYDICMRMKEEEVTASDLAMMKSIRKRLDDTIEKAEKAQDEPGTGEPKKKDQNKNQNDAKGAEEMKIDKSKLTPAELAFLQSIEKRYGEEEVAAGAEGVTPLAQNPEGIPATEVGKSNTPAQGTDGGEDIYKGMHPAVRAELENLKKFREATEERELEDVAKKYEIIGKKKEELVPVLKSLKAAGGTAYTDMIAVLDGAVAAVEKSGAFTEIGKSGGAGTTDGAAWLKEETQAAEIMKSKNVTKAQALDEVFQNDPELAAECEKEE